MLNDRLTYLALKLRNNSGKHVLSKRFQIKMKCFRYPGKRQHARQDQMTRSTRHLPIALTNWTGVVALTSPQQFSSAWNATANASGTQITLRPNGNFTRPQVRSCTAT